MDVISKIIDHVLSSLSDLDSHILNQIEHVLLVQLKDYEIQERCTEIVPNDNTNMGLVRKFIATKKLEGKSERTLRRYQPELEKLVSFLDKKLFEVNPYGDNNSYCFYRIVKSDNPYIEIMTKGDWSGYNAMLSFLFY